MGSSGTLFSTTLVTVILGSFLSGARGLTNSSFFQYNVYDLTRLTISDIKLAKHLEILTGLAVSSSTATATQPESEVPNSVQLYLRDFKDANGLEEVRKSELKSVLGNPISIYRLIRRCYLYMREIIETLNATDIFNLQGTKEEAVWADYLHPEEPIPDLIPEKKDLLDAIDAILAVQSMYNFNVTEFADGNIRGLITKAKLRGIHCVEIGTRALKRGMFVAAVEWFEEGKRRTAEDGTILMEIVNEKIANSVKAHDQVWQKEVSNSTLGYGNVKIYLKPLNSVPAEQNIKVRDQLYNEAKGFDFSDVEVNSWGLCSGENLQNPSLRSRLFCWYEFRIHPIYRIGPLKMEFLSRQPDVFQVYNAFFEADMREMRVTKGTFLFGIRDAQDYLPDELDLKMARKLGYMMGADVPEKRRDRMQMLRISYSYGFEFLGRGVLDGLLHVDEATPDPYEYFASVLVYLNKVEQGGNTAFPVLLTYAEPIVGSAVFYFNVLSDGTPDRLTLHFACPVSVGQKWIMVQRFAFADQRFSKKPCPLRPKAWFELPVNGQYLPIPKELRKNLDEEEEKALKDLFPGLNELRLKYSKTAETDTAGAQL